MIQTSRLRAKASLTVTSEAGRNETQATKQLRRKVTGSEVGFKFIQHSDPLKTSLNADQDLYVVGFCLFCQNGLRNPSCTEMHIKNLF